MQPINFRKRLLISLFFFSSVLTFSSLKAQYTWNNDSAFKAGAPNSGRIWGYAFGDYYYKGHADTLNRGGNNQYTGIPQGRNAFQFRRIYLGYDYNINKKFSTELLLAAEDNFPAGNPPSSTSASGDELINNKLSFYIKLANIRVKNIWKGTDLVVGQQATPAFPMTSERIWAYRSVERTIADIRRTPSYDFGAGLQGVFDPNTKNFGYDVLVANGSSAKPEGDAFKWLYGDVYAYFLNKRIIADLYGDYERLNWTPAWHHSRQMIKGFIAFNSGGKPQAPLYAAPGTVKMGAMDPSKGFTVGVEAFINNLKQDNFATKIAGGTDTLDVAAKGISVFVHGSLILNRLAFFARYDMYNPMNKIDNSVYSAYKGNTSSYNDPVTKETFVTAGLDYTPAKGVHLMPNIWYNSYKYQGPDKSPSPNPYDSHDLVYRLTFYFVFGR
jgi:hypothetical protein